MKNKWLAAALNLAPGVGYLYVGVRTPFAVMLLSVWPLLMLAGIMIPAEELAAAPAEESASAFNIWAVLPFLVFYAAFLVDGFFEAVRVNKSLKRTKAKG